MSDIIRDGACARQKAGAKELQTSPRGCEATRRLEMPSSQTFENNPEPGMASAAGTLSDLKEKSEGLASSAIQKVADSASSAKAAASQFGSDIASTLREGAETQKNAGADAVTALARSARSAADDLEDSSPEVARLVRTSADAVERVSTNVRDQSLSDLIDATGNFAVRHPVAFFGCGILAGFMVARFLAPPQQR
jgi:hypothetical protein